MSRESITDEEALAAADRVDLWIASVPAPKDTWTLAEAVRWALVHPKRETISLFRPPGGGTRAAWVHPAQMCRLAALLPDCERLERLVG